MNPQELREALSKGPAPQRLLETQQMCIALLNEQKADLTEERTGFWTFLADVFRHIDLRLWGMQILILIFVCAGVLSVPNVPNTIPLFTPLFILASIPSLFRNQIYGMCEIEAATRASTAQIILAKLVLVGAADLVSLSITLALASVAVNFSTNMVQLILFAVVPFLACMTVTLGCIRKCKRNALQMSIIVCLGTSIFAGGLAHWVPRIYELSALGLWIVAFMIFSCFFVREIYLLIAARKDGKIYGIIA